MTERFRTNCRKISAFAAIRSIFALYATFLFQGFPSWLTHDVLLPAELPLFDVSCFYLPTFTTGIKVIFVVSLLCFVIGYRVEISGITGGLSQLLLNVIFPAGIFSFSYFAPLAYLAFAVTELTRKSKNRDFPPEMALAFFLTSLYLSAALQKSIHFELMRLWLPHELNYWARDEFLKVCAGGNCALTDFVSLVVIPIEFCLGIFFLFRATRIYGVALAAAFHTGMYSVVALRSIGLEVLGIQCAIAVLASGSTAREVLFDKRIWKLIAFEIPLATLSFALLKFQNPYVPLFRELILTIMTFLPILSIAAVSLMDQKQLAWQLHPTYPTSVGWAHIALLCFLACFSLFPSIEGYRKTQSLGWAMFSGAYFSNRYYYSIEKDINCSIADYAPAVSHVRVSAGQSSYGSFDQDIMRRFFLLSKKRCGYSKIPELRTTYLNSKEFFN